MIADTRAPGLRLVLLGATLTVAVAVSRGGAGDLSRDARGQEDDETRALSATARAMLLRRQAGEGAAEAAILETVVLQHGTAGLGGGRLEGVLGFLGPVRDAWRRLEEQKPWAVAVGASLLSSVLCVCGLATQKRGLAGPNLDRYPAVGSIVLSPLWLLGLVMVVCANVFGDYEAYSLAPLSLTAPLSGVTVVLNLVLVPFLLGERVQAFPDVPAAALICSGGALTTLYGAHQDERIGPRELASLARSPANVLLYGLLLLALAGLARLSRTLPVPDARRPFCRSRLTYVAVPAAAAAAAGCLLNLHLKAAAELLKSGAPPLCVSLALALCVPYSLFQMNFISRGLGLFMQTVFVPVYNSFLMVSLTMCAAGFYGEGGLLAGPSRFFFVGGIALIVLGLWLLARAETPCSDAGPAEKLVMRSQKEDMSPKAT